MGELLPDGTIGGYEGYCPICGLVIKKNIQGNEIGNHLCKPYKIAVLCAHKKSNYYQIPGLEVYDKDRNCRTFKGGIPIIAHPPCAQWSRMKAFSNDNPDEKQLAYFCLVELKRWGGIFEHPKGSAVWDEFDWPIGGKFIEVDQHWFGFPARKRTILFFYKCNPIKYPLNFNAIQYTVCLSRSDSKNGQANRLPEMKKSQRSITALEFNQWLVDCIRQTYIPL